MYGIKDMKIRWFAISSAFQKDVWDKWYENTLVCDFSCFSKGFMCWMISKYLDLQFLMLFKNVLDKWYENTLI